MHVRLYDEKGLPLVCYVCGAAATGCVNVALACASSVPATMKPVCAEHFPYRVVVREGSMKLAEVPQGSVVRIAHQDAKQPYRVGNDFEDAWYTNHWGTRFRLVYGTEDTTNVFWSGELEAEIVEQPAEQGTSRLRD